MDKKILNLLNKWKENNLITSSTYQEIVEFESNSSPTQKSKVAKAMTLIGSLFLLSGLLGTLPLIWDNLTYWAQLLLLVVTTVFLIYAANYSEKFEDKNISGKLLEIPANKSMPKHGHEALEATLVLHGGYSDEKGEYNKGDLVVASNEEVHSPVSASSGCICLVVYSGSLQFKGLLGSILNLTRF